MGTSQGKLASVNEAVTIRKSRTKFKKVAPNEQGRAKLKKVVPNEEVPAKLKKVAPN